MDIALIGNTTLRTAIQRNLVSFPSQIPAFMRRQVGDTQERIVQLYFVRGWPIRAICARYCLSKAMVQKLLSEWRIRAVGAGYVQEIYPDVSEVPGRDQQLHQEQETVLDSDSATSEAPWQLAAPSQPVSVVSVAGGL